MAGELEFEIVNGHIVLKDTSRIEEIIDDFWEDVKREILGDLDLRQNMELEMEYLKLFDDCMFDMRSKIYDKRLEILSRSTRTQKVGKYPL